MSDLISGIATAIQLITSLDSQVVDITLRTLRVTFTSVIIGTIISLPLGTTITFRNFRGKEAMISLIQTMYALPTVIVGLVCFMLLSRAGPFGFLGWLYTPTGIVVGQTILVI